MCLAELDDANGHFPDKTAPGTIENFRGKNDAIVV